MKRYKSNWWSLAVPTQWAIDREDTCVTFQLPAAGALQISAARNLEGSATDADLREFAADDLDAGAPTNPITCGAFTGYYLKQATGEPYQRQWWLRGEDTVVLATYTTETGPTDEENAAVDAALRTLARK